MKRFWILAPLVAMVAAAQTAEERHEVGLFFGNGLGLALHSVSTGGHAKLSMTGKVSTHGGNQAYRVVLDSSGAVLFAYIIESDKTATEMNVHLRPVDQAQIRQRDWFPKNQPSGDVATLAAPRDFPGLKLGEGAQVDILYHPGTGEKISDVLRVISDTPPPAPRRVPGREGLLFDEVTVVIDGKTIVENRRSMMSGQAMKVRVPGYGEYYLVLIPPTSHPFQASGWVDHNVLRFAADGHIIEITGMSNILRKSDYGTIWVYHVPERELAKKVDSVDFHCADSFEQLKSAGSE